MSWLKVATGSGSGYPKEFGRRGGGGKYCRLVTPPPSFPRSRQSLSPPPPIGPPRGGRAVRSSPPLPPLPPPRNTSKNSGRKRPKEFCVDQKKYTFLYMAFFLVEGMVWLHSTMQSDLGKKKKKSAFLLSAYVLQNTSGTHMGKRFFLGGTFRANDAECPAEIGESAKHQD